MDNMEIRVEYTGVEPNWGPMASAFARAIDEALDDEGNFKDPKLDAEFQEWLKEKERKEKAS